MKVFILEDDYTRTIMFREVFKEHVVFSTEDVYEAVTLFEMNQPFDIILLDHDLEPRFQSELEFQTGTTFAMFLATQQPHCQVIIHSYNPDGAARMEMLLRDAGWNVVRQPFGLALLDNLRTAVLESSNPRQS
jgi:CheY-like chemotaxis protein